MEPNPENDFLEKKRVNTDNVLSVSFTNIKNPKSETTSQVQPALQSPTVPQPNQLQAPIFAEPQKEYEKTLPLEEEEEEKVEKEENKKQEEQKAEENIPNDVNANANVESTNKDQGLNNNEAQNQQPQTVPHKETNDVFMSQFMSGMDKESDELFKMIKGAIDEDPSQKALAQKAINNTVDMTGVDLLNAKEEINKNFGDNSNINNAPNNPNYNSKYDIKNLIRVSRRK